MESVTKAIGLVFSRRGWHEKQPEEIIAETTGDWTEAQEAMFKEALSHPMMQVVISIVFVVYDYLRDKGEIPPAAPWWDEPSQ